MVNRMADFISYHRTFQIEQISIGPRKRFLGPFIYAWSFIGSAHDRPVQWQQRRDNVNIDI